MKKDYLTFETFPNKTLPDKTLPDKTLPDKTLPDKTLLDKTLIVHCLKDGPPFFFKINIS